MADLQAFSESDLLGLALGVARGAWRLRPLIGAGEPVLLVVKVLADVAGAGGARLDLVAGGKRCKSIRPLVANDQLFQNQPSAKDRAIR